MWKASHSATVNAPASVIWKYWAEVEKWPEYDISLKTASISGAFELGSIITLQPKNSPKVKVTLSIVTPDAGFASLRKLPLATLQFTHHIDEVKSGTTFTQSVMISGPLWWLYAPILGGKMEQDLKDRVNKIAILIEHEYDPATANAT